MIDEKLETLDIVKTIKNNGKNWTWINIMQIKKLFKKEKERYHTRKNKNSDWDLNLIIFISNSNDEIFFLIFFFIKPF